MEKIKKFTDIVDIKNKRVLLRSDFNVPVFKEEIHDKTRIDVSIPFIQNLLKKEAKVILISHLGRPKSEKDMNLSLKPIFKYLQEKIDHKIHFYSHKITNNTKEKISFLKSGEIIFFENIRFNVGEIKNDENFAKNLSSVADIYINDAFSCCHRMQASVHKIAKFVKNSYAGPLLMKEISSIDMVLSNKKNPTTCIIGGSKVSTKIGVIVSLIKKVNNLILVGAMANNFIKFKGNNVGKSLIEDDSDKMIKEIYDKAKKNNCEIITPLDVAVSESMNGEAKLKDLNKITDNEMILDIGSKTIEKIYNIIDISKTVLWNGPAGYFENENFSKGTISIAEKISNMTKSRSLISIVGGGDTVSAVKNNHINIDFTHLSTAGGAFLEYIEGKNLPGVEVLK
jgi:phosphoglycerate kinase